MAHLFKGGMEVKEDWFFLAAGCGGKEKRRI